MAILTADPSGNRPKPWVIPTEISMTIVASVRQQWLANPRRDLLAGTVVALALIPEAGELISGFVNLFWAVDKPTYVTWNAMTPSGFTCRR